MGTCRGRYIVKKGGFIMKKLVEFTVALIVISVFMLSPILMISLLISLLGL